MQLRDRANALRAADWTATRGKPRAVDVDLVTGVFAGLSSFARGSAADPRATKRDSTLQSWESYLGHRFSLLRQHAAVVHFAAAQLPTLSRAVEMQRPATSAMRSQRVALAPSDQFIGAL